MGYTTAFLTEEGGVRRVAEGVNFVFVRTKKSAHGFIRVPNIYC